MEPRKRLHINSGVANPGQSAPSSDATAYH